jgi:translation initiation factor 1A
LEIKYEEENIRLPLPNTTKNEVFAVVDQRLGRSRMNVTCGDGKSRLARIPGSKRRKLKKIVIGDLLIIKPWDIQNDKADIRFKYKRNQVKLLSRKKLLPDEIDVFR